MDQKKSAQTANAYLSGIGRRFPDVISGRLADDRPLYLLADRH